MSTARRAVKPATRSTIIVEPSKARHTLPLLAAEIGYRIIELRERPVFGKTQLIAVIQSWVPGKSSSKSEEGDTYEVAVGHIEGLYNRRRDSRNQAVRQTKDPIQTINQ